MKKRKKNSKRKQAVSILEQKHLRQLKIRWLIKIFTLLLFIAVLFWCTQKLHDPQTFPIQIVTLEGETQHLDKRAISQAIQPFLQNSFFTINLVGLRERLLQFAWLKSVFISREWPNRLRIRLEEQKPAAVWNNNALLSQEGMLFNATLGTTLHILPHLVGQEGEQNTVWETYRMLSKAFAPKQLKITRLELSEQQTWIVELNNGITLIAGQKNLALRVQHFIRAYPKLVKENTAIRTVDLRYAQGMAVQYKPEKTI